MVGLPPVRLGRSLASALRTLWERLGVVLAVSMVGTLALLISLTVALIVPAALPLPLRAFGVGLIVVVVVSPWIAASYDAALRLSTHREITSAHLLQALRQFGGVAIRLGLIHLVVALLVILNVGFYLHFPGIGWRAIVVLCVYLGLFWSAMALYQGPLLILQETGAFDEPNRRAKRGARAVIRRSFYLALGEPLFSLGLWLAVLIWSTAAVLSAVGAAMLWLGGACVLTTAPTLALLTKYGVIQPVEVADDPPTKEA